MTESHNHKWLMTKIKSDSTSSDKWYFTQFYAISGSNVTPEHLKSRIVGFCYENVDAKYCLLGDIIPSNINLTPDRQTC
jgi:hypothetical protein